MSYTYSQENQFEKPCSYMYTPYGGKSFLLNFFESRQNYFKKLNFFPEINLLFAKIKNSFESSLDLTEETDVIRFLNEFNRTEEINVTDLFKKINYFFWFTNLQDTNSFKPILDIFCKKYEVFKRIFTFYKRNKNKLKKSSNNYMDVSIYSLVSLSFLFFFEKTRNLKFLSCALKINDLLCSVFDIIKNESEEVQAAFFLNLLIEKKLIEDFIMSKGVVL